MQGAETLYFSHFLASDLLHLPGKPAGVEQD